MSTKNKAIQQVTSPKNKILALSNDIAEYPPTNLTMHEWQALIVLSSVVNSKEQPIYGIEDIQEIAKERGLVTKKEQNQLLNDLVNEQNRYEMTYDELFGYYDGEKPLSRKTKHDILQAMKTLSNKNVVTANSEKVYASFNWFDGIFIDKENKIIRYILGQVSKTLLMGLNKNFLQMMARLSIRQAKKYDIPIFIHMKSKLHHKREAYSFTEPLPQFKERFGHDKIPSYNAWKDYYRRVLRSAQEYSLKTGDIAFTFEGKTTKGRKVTHIHYKIWRIGNIYAPRLKEGQQEKNLVDERRQRWKELERKMTVQQSRAYEYLKSLSINHGFLLDECIFHNCLQHEMVIGYEDVFLKLLWNRFSTYTKAKKKAGAFVTWWRRGRLTEGDHYWATIEVLSQKKKEMNPEEKDERKTAASMSYGEYTGLRKRQKTQNLPDEIIIPEKKKIKGNFSGVGELLENIPSETAVEFDYKTFKSDYSKEFNEIKENLLARLATIYLGKGKNFKEIDIIKIPEVKKQLEKMLPQHCELWYKEHVLK